jgi:hypothetical protein
MREFLFDGPIRPVWLVVVDYLHVFRTRTGPPEHDPPLIIDADRVLARQIALKPLKAVAGRRTQGLKKAGGVHHNQFSASYLGEICRETLRDHAALKDWLGKFPLEAPDHVDNVSHRDTTRERRALPRRSAPLDSRHSTRADAQRSEMPVDGDDAVQPAFKEWLAGAVSRPGVKQHFLNFFPLPHGQGRLRPTLRKGLRSGTNNCDGGSHSALS